ncbi:MAG: hypothetical protein OXE97_08125 [Gammaproteobacteria bacterium]|nr:hypothetical protein [Gammaproteobacteria bacterium]MCY4210990.1 hypothetical protein [Gammaproteobacteria bacterium]
MKLVKKSAWFRQERCEYVPVRFAPAIPAGDHPDETMPTSSGTISLPL